MSGFVARSSPATGAHDPLTVRAVVVEDTAVVTVDVVGLHEDLCAQIRARCPLPDDQVVVHATHTHGGPASMPGRLGAPVDESWLQVVADECVAAVEAAVRDRRPAMIRVGCGGNPGVARNRRRSDGPVDAAVPVVRLVGVDGVNGVDGRDGVDIAVLVSYACHPVVLGADNTRWTADYPGAVRDELEVRHPGAVAVFLTGCAGDTNTGHPVAASVTTTPSPGRTFDEARMIGVRVAEAACAAPAVPAPGPVTAARAQVPLDLDLPERDELLAAAATWRAQAEDSGADQAERALLSCWAQWAQSCVVAGGDGVNFWTAPVTVLQWGGALLVFLPGEPFAASARALRGAMGPHDSGRVVLVLGYTDGCPGYLPPAGEYEFGGYEVTEAHRYYGMPGPFAPGSAERLVERALKLVTDVCAEAAGVPLAPTAPATTAAEGGVRA